MNSDDSLLRTAWAGIPFPAMVTYPHIPAWKDYGAAECPPTVPSARMSTRASATLMGWGQALRGRLRGGLPSTWLSPCPCWSSLHMCWRPGDIHSSHTHPSREHPCVPSLQSLPADWCPCLAVLGTAGLKESIPRSELPSSCSHGPQPTLPGCPSSKKDHCAFFPPRLCSWCRVTR